MGEDPDAIRQEIAETRDRMGETVEAIGYKADVPSRTKDFVAEKREAVTGTVGQAAARLGDMADRAVGKVNEKTPSRGEMKGQAGRAASAAQRNPLGLAIGGVAAGFLVGLALPSTRVEDERIGPVADEVKDRAKETGQEALQHGREVAQEAARGAAQAAQQAGSEHAQQLAETAKEHGQAVASTAREQAPGQS